MSPLLLLLVFCGVIIIFLLWRVSVLTQRVEQGQTAFEKLADLNEELAVKNQFLEPLRKIAHPHDVQYHAKQRSSRG